jgi:hypothetical protein
VPYTDRHKERCIETEAQSLCAHRRKVLVRVNADYSERERERETEMQSLCANRQNHALDMNQYIDRHWGAVTVRA